MLPRIRALAIDDNGNHLKRIQDAARLAGIACLPLRHPAETESEYLTGLDLGKAQIRIVICDLHLMPGSETNHEQAIKTVANLLVQLQLPPWTPFVFVLWTRYAEQLDALRTFLCDRIDPKYLPTLMVALDKNEYKVDAEGDVPVESERLWRDLRDKIHESRGINLLMQWEKEILLAADGVVRNLIQLARRDKQTGEFNKKVAIDNEIDRVVSLVARSATSKDFARDNPRPAANEGLIPLLTDELQHLQIDGSSLERWDRALSNRNEDKLPATDAELPFFYDAFLISRDANITGTHRGAVLDEGWHDDEQFAKVFGANRNELKDVFGLMRALPNPLRIRYVQVEGLCDSAQQKKGVIPFVLACEVPADTEFKAEKSRPASVDLSPPYKDIDGNVWKLVVKL